MDLSSHWDTELLPVLISAVLVTKGDVDMAPLLSTLPFDDIVVWDNSKREDLKVLGRYAAVKEAKYSTIYTQDDDCIVDAAMVAESYEAGRVVCNMPLAKRDEYRTLAPGIALVGWGSCFDVECVGVLDRYMERYGIDELFKRECDRVFTALNSITMIDVPFRHLPTAFGGRMGDEGRHLEDLAEIQRRIATL